MYPVLRFAVFSAMLATAMPAAAQEKAETVAVATRAAYKNACPDAWGGPAQTVPPERFEVVIPGEGGLADEPVVVWRALCLVGGRTASRVFWVETEDDGLMPLAFPVPMYQETRLVPGDDQSPLKAVKLTGWTTTSFLSEGEFVPETLEFSQAQLWGVSYVLGEWRLGHEGAEIVSFGRGQNLDSAGTWFLLYGHE